MERAGREGRHRTGRAFGSQLLEILSNKFFENDFKSGTLVVIDGFDVQDYGKYFSVGSTDSSYLYNYLRFITAHGDVRQFSAADSGFTKVDTTSVLSNKKSKPANLRILTDPTAGAWNLEVVPYGYPLQSSRKMRNSFRQAL